MDAKAVTIVAGLLIAGFGASNLAGVSVESDREVVTIKYGTPYLTEMTPYLAAGATIEIRIAPIWGQMNVAEKFNSFLGMVTGTPQESVYRFTAANSGHFQFTVSCLTAPDCGSPEPQVLWRS